MLKEKRALVTGSTSGIGLAIADVHFPVFFLLRYATELLKSAKRRTAEGERSAFDFAILRSIGIAGAITVALAVIASLTLLPALLGVLGARVDRLAVRKVSYGVGVERIFPLHSPLIQKIDIVQRGRARRAKLYFIRNLSDREIRRKLRADRKRIDQDRAAERAAKEEAQKSQEPKASQE